MRKLIFGKKYGNPFIAVFDTTKTSAGSTANNQVKIPLLTDSTFPLIIDWGDGNKSTITSITDSNLTHTYSLIGTYIIKIFGNPFELGFKYLGDINKITDILSFGDMYIKNYQTFGGCNNIKLDNCSDFPKILPSASLDSCFNTGSNALTSIKNFDKWDLSTVSNLQNFLHSSYTFNQPLLFNTSNVLNMAGMLGHCYAFNQPLDNLIFNKNVILQNFMAGKTSENYSATYYDALLQKWASTFIGTGRTQTNKNIGMGTIKYTSAGKPYRDALVADDWVITDGGIV